MTSVHKQPSLCQLKSVEKMNLNMNFLNEPAHLHFWKYLLTFLGISSQPALSECTGCGILYVEKNITFGSSRVGVELDVLEYT